MKLELIRITKFGEDNFYEIYVDDKYIKGSSNLKVIEQFYEDIKNGMSVEPKKDILRSDEINVPSQK